MKRHALLVLAGLLLVPVTASAEVDGVGPRLGVGVDPDQFNFGAQVRIGPYSPDIFLVPNLEIGLGDDLTIVQFNFDVDWMIHTNSPQWGPYVGGGLGVAFIDFQDDFRSQGDDTRTEAGINFLGGLEFENASGKSSFFTELRLGVGDIPDLKVMAGWNFAP